MGRLDCWPSVWAAPEYLHLQPFLAASCFWGGILVFAVTVFVVAALQSRERERQKSMWPIYVMAAGMVVVGVGAAGFFWPQPSGPTLAENISKPDAPVNKSAAAILLDAALEQLPRISPADGIIYTFAIVRDKNGIQAYPSKYQLNPNAAIDWTPFFPDWPIWGISKWEITSTTTESVFEAVIPIKLIFKEMIPFTGQPVQIGEMITSTNGKQMKSGSVVATKEIEIRIGRIQPQTPYILYFVNRTEYLVDIDVPPEGRVENFKKSELDEQKFGMKLGRTTGLNLAASSNAAKVPR
jgi:hypothetical protein